jgi:hypothetical protein
MIIPVKTGEKGPEFDLILSYKSITKFDNFFFNGQKTTSGAFKRKKNRITIFTKFKGVIFEFF